MIGCDSKPYASASHVQHEPRRTRRLLMHRKEIDRIESNFKKGILVPILRLYWKNRKLKSS